MVIKSDKRYYIVSIIKLFSIFAIAYLFFHDCPKELLLISSITIILYSIIIMCDFIMTARTLIFNKDGIEISILYYKKFYGWNELKFKKIESYKNFKLLKSNLYKMPPYVRCAKFYKKRIKKSNVKYPDSFFGIFHPISFIFVTFLDETIAIEDLKKYHPTKFTYDEKEFLSKMKEWNIDIEEDL